MPQVSSDESHPESPQLTARRRKRPRNARSNSRQSGQAPGWAWMLFGLSIGLAVALVVYLRTPQDSAPSAQLAAALTGVRQPAGGTSATGGGAGTARAPAGNGTAAGGAAGGGNPNGSSGGTSSAGSGSADSGSADNPAADEEFSFFRTLPESEVVIPESEFRAREQAGPPPEYIIQAGAFRTFDEADGVKARLAFLGIESKIESAIVGNELYHRVIVGPLTGREEINNTVRRLNAARIDSMPPRQVSR